MSLASFQTITVKIHFLQLNGQTPLQTLHKQYRHNQPHWSWSLSHDCISCIVHRGHTKHFIGAVCVHASCLACAMIPQKGPNTFKRYLYYSSLNQEIHRLSLLGICLCHFGMPPCIKLHLHEYLDIIDNQTVNPLNIEVMQIKFHKVLNEGLCTKPDAKGGMIVHSLFFSCSLKQLSPRKSR